MTKLQRFVATFLTLSLSACGGGDDEDGKLVGVWTGTAAGYSVTADIEAEYPSAGNLSLQGIMSTDRPACFTNAMLAGTLSLTSVDLLSSGSGTSSGTSIVRIRGEVMANTITGQIDVTTASSDCAITAVPIVLTR